MHIQVATADEKGNVFSIMDRVFERSESNVVCTVNNVKHKIMFDLNLEIYFLENPNEETITADQVLDLYRALCKEKEEDGKYDC